MYGLESLQYFLKCPESGKRISAWHDLDYESSVTDDCTISGVIEIIKGTKPKMEIMKELPYNPVMQDYSKDKATGARRHREYAVEPTFNYGFIPQTYCDQRLGGDGDAIDLLDLSVEKKPIMAFSDYLVLGICGLVDQGELDYKIVALELNEAKARKITCLQSYEKACPGHLEAIVTWFREYKVWEGKQPNKFLWNSEIKGPEKAMEIIMESHHMYNAIWKDSVNDTGRKRGYWKE